MVIERPTVTLRSYVAEMLGREIEIEEVVASVPARVEDHSEASRFVGQLRTSVERHRENLHHRLQTISPSRGEIEPTAPSARKEGASVPSVPQDLLGALRTLHGLLNQAALGYAVLHAVAHRFFDSRGDGNTADLAESHLRDYAQTAQALIRIVSDVVVWELDKLGQECQCKCPSCGLGVCLCSPHGTNTVADVWREVSVAGAEEQVGGLRVRPPRIDSPAGRAGLHAGDSVLLADGREIRNESWDSINTLQDAIKKHQPGELVRLKIRRAFGTLEEVPVTRA